MLIKLMYFFCLLGAADTTAVVVAASPGSECPEVRLGQAWA